MSRMMWFLIAHGAHRAAVAALRVRGGAPKARVALLPDIARFQVWLHYRSLPNVMAAQAAIHVPDPSRGACGCARGSLSSQG